VLLTAIGPIDGMGPLESTERRIERLTEHGGPYRKGRVPRQRLEGRRVLGRGAVGRRETGRRRYIVNCDHVPGVADAAFFPHDAQSGVVSRPDLIRRADRWKPFAHEPMLRIRVRIRPRWGYTYVTQLDRAVTASAFERLFESHHDAIRRYCRRRLDGPAADDAAADVFVVAWRRISEVPTGDQALLWLYGVARNVVARSQRSSRRRSRLVARALSLGEPAAEGAETVVLRNTDEKVLLSALSRLRAADQEILRLVAWEELSHAEIGSMLGLSVAAVDARASRALKRLRRNVTDRGDV